ncbi:MAG: hypothetical protein QOJ20_5113, partial [Mycobacterium sp.]|nr:hypothetical protein [Mycobacterium sp.]
HGVDIATQRFGINTRQSPPAVDEFSCAGTPPRERPQFCDRVAIPGDDHPFSVLHTFQHLSPFVAQLAHCH